MEEKKIINPMEPQPKTEMPDEAMLREMARWNTDKKGANGEWVYCKEHGIVWVDNHGDLMGGTPTPPNAPPSILGDLVKWGETLDLDSIKPNSVMVIKLAPKTAVAAQRIQQGIVNMILAPRAEKLKDKKLTVLFMAADDSIELIEESEMESAGWQKKNKSVIIDPFKK
jgi:hypothetical protein